jgi:hypothetical protein
MNAVNYERDKVLADCRYRSNHVRGNFSPEHTRRGHSNKVMQKLYKVADLRTDHNNH